MSATRFKNLSKPCPFCGGQLVKESELGGDWAFTTYYKILCKDCSKEGPTMTSFKEAIEGFDSLLNNISCNIRQRNVLQDWIIEECSLMMQGTLISAIRGCDGVIKEDISKKFTRALRSAVMNNACSNIPKFITFDVTEEDIKVFLKQPDHYPVHWLMHFMHAAEVVGWMHPDMSVCNWWRSLYFRMCDMLHVNPETKEQFIVRLRDGQEKDCWKS